MSTDATDDKVNWLWIENSIKEEHINFYEYSKFNNIKETGGEGFGKVYKAKWKQNEKYLALKSFNLDNATAIKEIVSEYVTGKKETNFFNRFTKKFILLFI